MRGFCLNWKVVAGLAVAGLGIWALAPQVWGAALPVLFVLACPLSMLFMMRAGGRQGDQMAGAACAMPAQSAAPAAHAGQPAQSSFTGSREMRLVQLKTELASTGARQDALARRISELELAALPAVHETEASAATPLGGAEGLAWERRGRTAVAHAADRR